MKQMMPLESKSELWFMTTNDKSEQVIEAAASKLQQWWRSQSREIESADVDMEDHVEIVKGDMDSISNYGSRDNEMQLMLWLNNYKIHESVGKCLIELGVRDIGDVKTFVTSGYHQTELVSVSFFDLRKLEKAVQDLTDEKASTDDDDVIMSLAD